MKCRKYVIYARAFISPWHFVTTCVLMRDRVNTFRVRGEGGVSKSHCGQASFIFYVRILNTQAPRAISDIGLIL